MTKFIDPLEWSSYAGVYQAYAWQQGAEGKAVKFRLPDENFQVRKSSWWHPDGFDLWKFWAVVSDLDDMGIHYWAYETIEADYGVDQYLTLVCTEDDSMIDQEAFSDYHTAHHWLEAFEE